MNYITEIKAFMDLVQVKSLSTGQIALWYALMYINNKCTWAEWFTVPNITLELYTGLSRQGIDKCRNVLKQYSVIDFKSNGTKATTYKLLTMSNSLQASVQDSSQVSCQNSVQDSLQVGCQNSGTLNKLNKTKLNEVKDISNDISKNTPLEQRFETFWKAYPKKTGKGAAEKSFEKIRPTKELFAEMMAALEAVKTSEQWQKDSGQFIPNPATWLNQKRWEDSPSSTTNGSNSGYVRSEDSL